jgi:diguanylate cyclase (GGDEF)-like protein
MQSVNKARSSVAQPLRDVCHCRVRVVAVKARILIVNGDSTLLSSAPTELELAGYEVCLAAGVHQALAAVNGKVPDVILVDISNSDTDGSGVTRQLKPDPRLRDVPIIALGGADRPLDAELSPDLGYSGYIAKPVDNVSFPELIASLVPARLEPQTLLIAEDHPANAEVLRLKLEGDGHTVLVAANGVEAMEILEREGARINGIVSDVLMPQMDGYNLCLNIRRSKNFSTLPFVLYSGTHNSSEDRKLGFAAGADAFIEKPASIQLILGKLRAAAGKRRPAVAPIAIPELEAPILKSYSEALVLKLEEKSAELERAAARILRLNRVLSVLSAINGLIVRTIDIDELLREACRIAVEAGQFPKTWIGLVDTKTKQLRFAAGHGATEAFYQRLKAALSKDMLDPSNFAATALRKLAPVVVNDLNGGRRTLTDPTETGSRAVAVLPLVIEGEGVGVISIHAEVAGFFDEEEMKVLSELAADISFALAHLRKSARIQYLANYDQVTGLPNRGLFSERLSLALQKQTDDGSILAVVLIDLERFRRINETLGRAAGDELLHLVARRLQQADASAARISVDVFAVELHGSRSAIELARAFEDLAGRCFGEPFAISGEELRVACRGGIAVFPNDGLTAETLLRHGEAALRQVKLTSERSAFYAPDLNARAAEALSMESGLRRAIKHNEFILHYQPKITLTDRRICGLEALIRWQDPKGRLLLPGRFIPVLEESGQIGEVGEWALRQALKDQRKWRAAGLTPPRVAVNVSAIQLRKQDFADVIARIIAANEDASLELEITESMIMEQVDRSIAALKQIRALGVSVAIDDFGTGYCSLSYVAKLPVTALKIDRTFIVEMTESADGLAIVSSMIALAHSLKLKVVAEGVETKEQEEKLRLLGCDEAQGYLFSKPVPYEAIEVLLRGDQILSVSDFAA